MAAGSHARTRTGARTGRLPAAPACTCKCIVLDLNRHAKVGRHFLIPASAGAARRTPLRVYSIRKAFTGLTDAARRAGIRLASSAMDSSSSVTPA